MTTPEEVTYNSLLPYINEFTPSIYTKGLTLCEDLFKKYHAKDNCHRCPFSAPGSLFCGLYERDVPHLPVLWQQILDNYPELFL